jgi:hypothetical protein
MGHFDGLHGFPGLHGPAMPHDHLPSHLEDVDHPNHDIGESGLTHYEALWIDLGGEG